MTEFLNALKKKIFLILVFLAVCIVIALLSFASIVKLRTPSLAQLSSNIQKNDLFFSFRYDESIQHQLFQFFDKMGILQFVDTWIGHVSPEASKKDKGYGAEGFLAIGIQQQQGVLAIRRCDQFLTSYFSHLDLLEDVDENSEDSSDTLSSDELDDDEEDTFSAVSAPFQQALETIWNGGFLNISGAIRLNLNFLESLQFATTSLIHNDEAFLKNAVLQSLSLPLQKTVAAALFDRSQFRIDKDKVNGFYFGSFSLDTEALDALSENLCNGSANISDVCRYLANDDYNILQQHLAALSALLGPDFEAQLHFYWAVKGSAFIFSNRSSSLKTLLDNDFSAKKSLLVPDSIVTNPQDSFLDHSEKTAFEPLPPNMISAAFNLEHIKDSMLTLLALLRTEVRKKHLLSTRFISAQDLLTLFNNFEEYALDLTNEAQKIGFGLTFTPQKIIPLQWLQPAKQLDSESIKVLENNFIVKVGEFLFPNSKKIARSLIPVDSILSQQDDGWFMTKATLLSRELSPIFQKRLREVRRPENSEL